jgi:hypothetical protein
MFCQLLRQISWHNLVCWDNLPGSLTVSSLHQIAEKRPVCFFALRRYLQRQKIAVSLVTVVVCGIISQRQTHYTSRLQALSISSWWKLSLDTIQLRSQKTRELFRFVSQRAPLVRNECLCENLLQIKSTFKCWLEKKIRAQMTQSFEKIFMWIKLDEIFLPNK